MSERGLSRYWNDRIDPFDWKKRSDEPGQNAWAQALDTFMAPHVERAFEWLGDLRGQRILDLGCGAGYGSVHLARHGASVVGLDLADRRCALAREQTALLDESLELTFTAGNAERLPFADESFDGIFASDVLMYSRPERVVDECYRVLVPGGKVVFIEALAGNAVFDLYRRWTESSEYSSFTRHLRLSDLCSVGRRLHLVTVRSHYLLSAIAFACLFLARSTVLYRLALRLLNPIDTALLSGFPSLASKTWRSAALYSKPVTRVA